MSNLNEKMSVQSADYAARMKEIELSNLVLDDAVLSGSLKGMLDLQKDSLITIDATHFSTLSQPVEESPMNLKRLVAKVKSDAPEMGVNAAKSSVKSVFKKVPLIEGIVDAGEILVRGKFKPKVFPEAAKALVADAAEEIPVVGKSFKHLIRNINLSKTKPQNSEESEQGADDLADGISVDGIINDTKKRAPEMVRIVAKSELKKALRELPFADGIVNAGAIMTEKGTNQKKLRAGQALFSDAAGEIPLVGGIAESLIKKINLDKLKGNGDTEEIVDEVYFVKSNENNQQQPQIEDINQDANAEASSKTTRTPQKIEPLKVKGNITQHIRQLRGQESGVENYVCRKSTVNLSSLQMTR